MVVAQTADWITMEDYLLAEQDGQVRNECLNGAVCAVTGGSVYHNRIAGALDMALREKLKGRLCDVFLADMKVRTQHAFYFKEALR